MRQIARPMGRLTAGMVATETDEKAQMQIGNWSGVLKRHLKESITWTSS